MAARPVRTRSLRIRSHTGSFHELKHLLEETARDCGCQERDIFDLKLAAVEAVANAVEHGSPRGSADWVEIDLTAEAEGVRIEVRDRGVFTNPVPSASDGTRGRGIPLMVALVDRVQISRSGQGTTVALWKRPSGDLPLSQQVTSA